MKKLGISCAVLVMLAFGGSVFGGIVISDNPGTTKLTLTFTEDLVFDMNLATDPMMIGLSGWAKNPDDSQSYYNTVGTNYNAFWAASKIKIERDPAFGDSTPFHYDGADHETPYSAPAIVDNNLQSDENSFYPSIERGMTMIFFDQKWSHIKHLYDGQKLIIKAGSWYFWDGANNWNPEVMGSFNGTAALYSYQGIKVSDDLILPEPATLGLLGLGGLFIRRRRKA